MTQKPASKDAASFVVRLALFNAGAYCFLGIQMPFLPVWLQAKGLDQQTIGFALAIPMVVRLLAVPIATGLTDHTGSFKGALVVTACLAALGYTIIGLSSGPVAIAIAMLVAAFAHTPILTLSDVYALKGLALHGRAYGPSRMWASVAFIAGNLGAGVLADHIASTNLIWLIVGALCAAALASLKLRPIEGERLPRAGRAGAAAAYLRSRPFLAVAATSSLVQASHAVVYGFSSLDWANAGLDGRTIGILWAIAVLAEITLFGASARLPLGPAGLLALGAAGAVVRWSAMALGPPVWLLVVLQCLHGLSFGATFLGATQFLARTAPRGLAATAQGSLVMANGILMASAMGLSGMLHASSVGLSYAVMAGAAAAGGVAAIVARRMLREAGSV